MGQSLKVAFSQIHEVQHVPGVPDGRKPGFFERYLYWRQCCLMSASVFGLLLMFSCLAKDAMRIRHLNKEFDLFPDELKEHFRYFVYLLLASSLFNTGLTVVVVFLLWAACCWQSRFRVSVTKERQAWGLLILGPFGPFVMVPFAASLRTDLLQRDICAVTLAGLMKSSMSRSYLQEAARQVSEPELAVVALYPPPEFGSDAWVSWQGVHWCQDHHADWEKRLFSSEWVKSAYVGFRDPRMTLPVPGSVDHPGVVPQMLRVMMGSIDVFVDPAMRFCYDNFLMKAQAIRDAFSGNLHGLVELGDGLPGGGAGPWSPTAGGWRHVATDAASADGRSGPSPWPSANTSAGSGGPSTGDGPGAGGSTGAGQWAQWGAGAGAAAGGLLDELAALADLEADGPAALLQLDAKKPLSVFTRIALSAICYVFRGTIGLLRVARLSGLLVVRVVGLYGAAQCVKLLALSIFSVVDGLVEGVVNAKKVIPTASLPGHILTVAVITSLPPVLLLLAVLSQFIAHAAFSAAMTCLAAWRVMDLIRAQKMVLTARPVQSMAEFDRITIWQGRIGLLSVVFIGIFIGRMIWIVKDGNVFAVGIPTIFERISLLDFLEPVGIIQMLARLIMVRILTLLVTSDQVMEAIFDSADDRLRGKDCEGEDIVNGWRRLNGKKLLARAASDIGASASSIAAAGGVAGPGLPEPPPQPEPIVFQVELEKTEANRKLGVVCGVRSDYLEVEEISGGLVGEWNRRNPAQVVQEADEIVEVNGVSGDSEAMRERLREDAVLVISIRREVQ